MELQKKLVEEFFDRNDYWQGKVYETSDDFFARAVLRRKQYAFEMLRQVPDLRVGVGLDIGCGCGVYIIELADMGFEVYGVDNSREMLRKAEHFIAGNSRASKIHLMPGDIEHLPFEDAKFDLVMCMGVLVYLLSDYAALSEMYRVLKPGGYLVVNINNLWNLTDLDYMFRRKITATWKKGSTADLRPSQPHTLPSEWILKNLSTPHRLKNYNLWAFERLMKSYNFELVDAMTFHFPLRLLRRLRVIPSSNIDALEVSSERFLRKYRIPLLSYLGTTYTGIYKKVAHIVSIVLLTLNIPDLLAYSEMFSSLT